MNTRRFVIFWATFTVLVVVMMFVTAFALASEPLSEDELTKIISNAKTVGNFSYIPLDNFYLSAEGSDEKVLQILNKFSEEKGVEIESFYLNKDHNSTRLFGIYVVHSLK